MARLMTTWPTDLTDLSWSSAKPQLTVDRLRRLRPRSNMGPAWGLLRGLGHGQPGSFASRKPGILDGTNWAARYRRADGIAAVETREGPEHSALPDSIPGCQPAAGVVSIRLGVSCASSIYIY